MIRFVAIATVFALAACGANSPTTPVDDTTPAHIGILSGDGRTKRVLDTITVAVIVTDAKNRPVAGAPVTFTVVAGEGSVSGGNVVTNASGAASTVWKLGRFPGFQGLRAAIPNITSNVAFGATATP